jgi:hypothetical protein
VAALHKFLSMGYFDPNSTFTADEYEADQEIPCDGIPGDHKSLTLDSVMSQLNPIYINEDVHCHDTFP